MQVQSSALLNRLQGVYKHVHCAQACCEPPCRRPNIYMYIHISDWRHSRSTAVPRPRSKKTGRVSRSSNGQLVCRARILKTTLTHFCPPLRFRNQFLPTVPTFAVWETNVSQHNGRTSGAPLKPLRDDSALRALSPLNPLETIVLWEHYPP